MKLVKALTIDQDPDEPQLTAHIYRRGKTTLYLGVESDRPAVPNLGPLKLAPTDIKEPEKGVESLLHIMRRMFRMCMGQSPDLPDHMKEVEAELPAYVHYIRNMKIRIASPLFGCN
jgi:hypothetical protein